MEREALIRRRDLLSAGAALPLLAALPAAAQRTRASNPLIRQRADPQIIRVGGWYYFMGSVPEYDRLALRRARTVAGLATAPETVVWRRPARGKMGGYIWAPEIHHFDGAWHIYFAAGDSDQKFRIRTYVLQTRAANPLTGQWSLLGQLQTPWDTFTLDSTVFDHRGKR